VKTGHRYILTPYFLDQALPGLDGLAEEAWFFNRQPLPPGDAQVRMSFLHEALAGEMASALDQGFLPVSIAGDCCAVIGVAAGLQRAGIDADLVWFDAHGDFNTWETTPSGFLGGMPLAMIAGLGEQTMPMAVGLRPWPHDQIFLTDGRDLDPGESALVQGSEINHILDPTQILSKLEGDRPLYIHFDTDLINPEDAPAMNYLAPGGPRPTELVAVFSLLAETGRIAAVSMSTWNPKLDVDRHTKKICLELLDCLLGN
jgi:arginase